MSIKLSLVIKEEEGNGEPAGGREGGLRTSHHYSQSQAAVPGYVMTYSQSGA